MLEKDIKKIIEDEKLKFYNWKNEHGLKENEVVLYYDNKWIVCVTDERASVVTGSYSYFDNEEDALDNFLNRLRSMNRLRNSNII
jgi:hypothetical protein